MNTIYQFIQHENNGIEYAREQAKQWRNMGYSVKTKKENTGISLTINKKLSGISRRKM